MPTFQVDFHYSRVITTFIEAEDESDIDKFLSNNPEFDIIDDYPDMIDRDETVMDDNGDDGYDITPASDVTANWTITPELRLDEID